MLVIFHPSEHMYSHSYMYSTDFFLYFRFTLTRNRVANEKGWLMPPFFVLGMFYNFNPVFQCSEHMYKCTCVLLIFFIYFRFTQTSIKHANPIHAPTTITSSSERAATHKSVPANHEPTNKGSSCYPFLF
jgi:hypothetical protein